MNEEVGRLQEALAAERELNANLSKENERLTALLKDQQAAGPGMCCGRGMESGRERERDYKLESKERVEGET